MKKRPKGLSVRIERAELRAIRYFLPVAGIGVRVIR